MAIRFGTEGWRAVLADDYTFDNVHVVARAAGRWFARRSEKPVVAVGRDTRFMGERFAAAVADELAQCGVEARLCRGPLPTPALCYYVVQKGLSGGVMLTASHNTAHYNGVKVKTGAGASVPGDDAKWIGAEANRILEQEPPTRAAHQEHERFNVREDYLNRILSLVDREAIARAGLTVVADMMHGAGCGYFDEALRRASCVVNTVRDQPDPTFAWRHPEPIGPNLGPSISLTAAPEVAVGLATDGDADRFGMMADGEYIDIQRAIVFILYHLLKNRGWRGRVVRSLNVTSMVDRLCEHYGCEVTEASVGFKNIAPQIVESEEVLLGVEESGGFGFRGHVPDRDGALAALIACEALAQEGKPVAEVLADAYKLTGGRLYFDRLDLRVKPEQRGTVADGLPKLAPDRLAGEPVAEVSRLDGAKVIRKDGSWLLMRPSGTEPLVRIYAEARSEDEVQQLLYTGRDLILEMVGG